MALIRARSAVNVDLLAARQGQPDIDLIKPTLAMVLAGRLEHYSAGRHARIPLLEPAHVTNNLVAQRLTRIHALKFDLNRRLHLRLQVTWPNQTCARICGPLPACDL